MIIGVLSMKPTLYSTRRLIEEAEKRGHTVVCINYKKCVLGLSSSGATVLHQGEPLKVDVLIPRLGATSGRFGAAVVRQLEAAGIPSTSTAGSLMRSRDKSGTAEVLGLAGSVPVVVKLLEGSAGSGVVLAETKKAAESLLSAFHQLDAEFLVQGFVKEAAGRDLRVLVVGGRVVAAMERRAAAGDFRANIHQGGSAVKIKLTPQEKRVALAAAKAVGLSVAGVDLLRGESGPLVLEVNSSPGLEGIENTTKIDVAGKIVEFAEKLTNGSAQHPSPRTRRVS